MPLPRELAKRAWVVAGPTAVGKSELALRLARHLGGEIVSVDSMQAYRGMDIGTAKPTPSERQEIRHHLQDVADVRQPFDAVQFASLAQAAIEDILARGGVPVLCGGSGLYFKALLQGFDADVLPDSALRAELERTSPEALRAELCRRDPEAVTRVDVANPRRLIRAVEILRLSGKPLAEFRSEAGPVQKPGPQAPWWGLERAREDLSRRIDERVEAMFAAGLVQETRRLLSEGLGENRNACQALGYKQVLEHLEHRRSLSETIALVKTKTRQYAKRQMTWFKRQMDLNWAVVGPDEPGEALLHRVLVPPAGKFL